MIRELSIGIIAIAIMGGGNARPGRGSITSIRPEIELDMPTQPETRIEIRDFTKGDTMTAIMAGGNVTTLIEVCIGVPTKACIGVGTTALGVRNMSDIGGKT
ncbi:MAG: hypothetical protein PHW74_12440 [Desulfobacca sp.]|nr:hypothetical protein [Desulfobacca sp.]